MKKKIVIAVLAALLCFAAAGCAEAGTPSGDPPTPPPQEETGPSQDAGLTVSSVLGETVKNGEVLLSEEKFLELKNCTELDSVCAFSLDEKATLTGISFDERYNRLTFSAEAESGGASSVSVEIKTTYRLDDTFEGISYFGTGWQIENTRADRYGRTMHSAPDDDAAFAFTADGCTQIRLYGYRSTISGSFETFLDGVSIGVTQTESGGDELTQACFYDSGVLPKGPHTFRFNYKGGWVELDYIEVVCGSANGLIGDSGTEIFAVCGEPVYNGTVTLSKAQWAALSGAENLESCVELATEAYAKPAFSLNGVEKTLTAQTKFADGSENSKTISIQVDDVSVLDDGAEAFAYTGAGWRTETLAGRRGGAAHTATGTGSFTLAADACTQIVLYGRRAGGMGTAEVFVDDVSRGTLTLSSAGAEILQARLFDTGILPFGRHTVRFELRSGRAEIDFAEVRADSTVRASQALNQNAFAYSGAWQDFKGLDTARYLGGDARSTQAAGATLTLAVADVERVQFFATQAHDRGGATVYLDGAYAGYVSERSSYCGNVKLLYDSGRLSAGSHTLTFVTDGVGWFEVDRINFIGENTETMWIDDSNTFAFFRYNGTARAVEDASAACGSYRELSAGGVVSVAFFGTAFKALSCGENTADVAVTVDGGDYAADGEGNVICDIRDLGEGMHKVEIEVLTGTLKFDGAYTDDVNLTTVYDEMTRLAQEEVADKKAGLAEKSAEGWQPVARKTEVFQTGISLDGGLFGQAFANDLAYFDTCSGYENYVKTAEWWSDVLSGSNYGRMLAVAGHALRWTVNESQRAKLNAVIDDVLTALEANCRKYGGGYLMAYDPDYMGNSHGSGEYGERPAYDCSMLVRGLVAAGLAKELGGTPLEENRAYTLLRGFYDWWETDGEAVGYGRKILEQLLGIQGITGYTMTYNTPIGQPSDILKAQENFVMDWWLEYLANGISEAVSHYPLNRPHSYLCTAMISFMDIYFATGDVRYLNACKGYYDIMTKYYMTDAGTVEICEFDDYEPGSLYVDGAHHTGEACSAVFFTEFCQRLLALYPTEEQYADKIEKEIYNVIIPAQESASGIRYHARHNLFVDRPTMVNTCCEVTSTGLLARLQEFIFTHSADAVYVNLYEPAALDAAVGGQRVRLKLGGSSYLGEDVTLEAEEGTGVKLFLRIPSHANAAGVVIRKNGAVIGTAGAGSYYAVTVDAGDTLTYSFGTEKPTPRLYTGFQQADGASRYSFMRGNVLYAVVAHGAAGHTYRYEAIGKTTEGGDEYVLRIDMPVETFVKGLTASGNAWRYLENGVVLYELIPYKAVAQNSPFALYPVFSETSGAWQVPAERTDCGVSLGSALALMQFDVYSSTGGQGFYVYNGMLNSFSDGEEKAFLRGAEADGYLDVAVTMHGPEIDAGIYLNAGEAGSARDAVDGCCVAVERDVNEGAFYLKVFAFDNKNGNGGYLGCCFAVKLQGVANAALRMRLVAEGDMLQIVLSQGGAQFPTFALHMPQKVCGRVGLRSNFSAVAFSDIVVSTQK